MLFTGGEMSQSTDSHSRVRTPCRCQSWHRTRQHPWKSAVRQCQHFRPNCIQTMTAEHSRSNRCVGLPRVDGSGGERPGRGSDSDSGQVVAVAHHAEEVRFVAFSVVSASPASVRQAEVVAEFVHEGAGHHRLVTAVVEERPERNYQIIAALKVVVSPPFPKRRCGGWPLRNLDTRRTARIRATEGRRSARGRLPDTRCHRRAGDAYVLALVAHHVMRKTA